MIASADAALPIQQAPPPSPMPPAGVARGVAPMRVDGRDGNLHDRVSRGVLLDRIAGLLDLPLLPAVTVAEAVAGDLLLVPGETLVEPAGTIAPSRLLGGAVPARFVATKAIAHGLLGPDAVRPPRWDLGLAHEVGGAVLRGLTAFDMADAMAAGRRLLADGPVRIKDTCGKAGLGQEVVADEAALAEVIAAQDAGDLADHGIVLEENLTDVVTYSVGATTLAGRTISYWGTQGLTTDHRGRQVYGGSDLTVMRGDLDALAASSLPAGVDTAVTCAALFDGAVRRAYPEAVLTRRNYDVIDGTDAQGRRRIAVLEQSWRIGGASGAELAAMEALRADPAAATVRCATVELYAAATPPADATVYFDGVDPAIGPMLKYAVRLA